jgi:hypothetical protein
VREISDFVREISDFVREFQTLCVNFRLCAWISDFVREISDFVREISDFAREFQTLCVNFRLCVWISDFVREISDFVREFSDFVREFYLKTLRLQALVKLLLSKSSFFCKIWWKGFYETKCRKNFSTKFCLHTVWQVLLFTTGCERQNLRLCLLRFALRFG